MRLLELYALSQLGTLYRWGGDDPSGWDCSGLVIEILQSTGLLPPYYDTTSQGLYDKFSADGVINAKGLGCLVFFGRSVKAIKHVGFMLDNRRMLEAGGGGSKIKTPEDAIKHNAFVRIRPITWRKDMVATVKPHYNLTQ